MKDSIRAVKSTSARPSPRPGPLAAPPVPVGFLPRTTSPTFKVGLGERSSTASAYEHPNQLMTSTARRSDQRCRLPRLRDPALTRHGLRLGLSLTLLEAVCAADGGVSVSGAWSINRLVNVTSRWARRGTHRPDSPQTLSAKQPWAPFVVVPHDSCPSFSDRCNFQVEASPQAP